MRFYLMIWNDKLMINSMDSDMVRVGLLALLQIITRIRNVEVIQKSSVTMNNQKKNIKIFIEKWMEEEQRQDEIGKEHEVSNSSGVDIQVENMGKLDSIIKKKSSEGKSLMNLMSILTSRGKQKKQILLEMIQLEQTISAKLRLVSSKQ